MNALATYRILHHAVSGELRRLSRKARLSTPTTRRAIIESLDSRVLMSAVHGAIYNDLNANGAQDYGEAGVAGIVVYEDANSNGHYDSGEPCTTSADDGTYTLSGLSAGEHTIAVVTPSGNADSTGAQTVSFSDCSSTVDDLDFGQVPALAGPTDFNATADGSNEIDLSWTNNASNATGFELYRATDGGSPSLLVSLDSSSTSYDDTGLTDGTTYSYELSVLGPNGPTTVGPASQHLNLAAPTALEITDSGSNYLDVDWVNNSTHADVNAVVEVSTNGGSYASIGETDGADYEDTAISDGNVYVVSVHATDGSEDSSASNTVTLNLPLSAAGDLAATAASSGEVDLSWTNNSSSNPSFQIERKADNDVSYSLIATTSAGATTYADTSVSENTGYSYQVVAVLGGVSSDPSSVSSATTPPSAPYDVSVIPDSDGGISVTWANSDSGVPVEIDRVSDGSATPLATLSGGATSYYDGPDLPEATQYSYQIIAIGSAANSATAESASVYTTPAAPSNLAATAVSSGEIDLTWQDNSSAGPGFVVKRLADGDDSYSIIATLDSGTTSYADTDVSANTGYTYEICAVNQGVTSNPNGSAYVVTPC